MKLFRPLLLACLAFTFASVLSVVPSMATDQSPAVYTASAADDMLTAIVVADVMRIAVIALVLLALTLLVIAFVAAADRWWSRRRADRRLVFHDPWRLSEPYRRTPG